VQPQVRRQVALVARAVAAVLADKRLLPSVYSRVPRQAALVARAEVAVLADKRLLPSVYSQVLRQAALDARAVAAVRADKRLLPIVQPQVCLQVALDTRAVAAVLADKRPLPSVYSQVCRQVALVARAVAAVFALVNHHRKHVGAQHRSAVVFLLAFSLPDALPATTTVFACVVRRTNERQPVLSWLRLQGVSVCARESGPRRARLLVDAWQWQ
jgi:hypothetical protein